jgi:hypothetical protein
MDALDAIVVAADMASARRRAYRVQQSQTYQKYRGITATNRDLWVWTLPRFSEPGYNAYSGVSM